MIRVLTFRHVSRAVSDGNGLYHARFPGHLTSEQIVQVIKIKRKGMDHAR